MLLPDELTPPLADALGLMNFQTGPIAHVFRAAGHEIPHRCEDEQAFVLFWALLLAIEHGEGWRTVGRAEIEALRDRSPASRAAGTSLAREAGLR